MINAPCSHLGIEGAEAGAGAMLVAYRLAGLSELPSFDLRNPLFQFDKIKLDGCVTGYR